MQYESMRKNVSKYLTATGVGCARGYTSLRQKHKIRLERSDMVRKCGVILIDLFLYPGEVKSEKNIKKK